MRRAAKIDANQPAIVAALRKVGCSVQPLHAVGQGCPDLAVARDGRTMMLEVKDEAKPPSARQLTPAQSAWHGAWRGVVRVVKNAAEALAEVDTHLR